MLLFRRLLIFSHRYLGIAISLVCVVWFASGITMMYAGGMPRVTAQKRLARLEPLGLSRVRLTAAEAVARLQATGVLKPNFNAHAASAGRRPDFRGLRPELLTVLGRPAYRFEGPIPQTVFADTGEILHEIDVEAAQRVASRFENVSVERIHLVRGLHEPDQWTLNNRTHETLYKFRVDYAAATEVYVAARTADVFMETTRASRGLAWIGAIPHWIYFASLRTNQPLWYEIVVWLSSAASVLAMLGLILAFMQFRRTRPFSLKKAIVYRGWARWHYILGAIFGVFVLTWAFSGLMSMQPWKWTTARGLEIRRDVFTGGRTDLSQFGRMDPAAFARAVSGRSLKQIGFIRIQGEYYYTVSSTSVATSAEPQAERLQQSYPVGRRGEPGRILISAQTLEVRQEPFSIGSILSRLRSAMPNTPIVEQALLTDYDSYYYSGHGERPLPVLRVKFDDPMKSWIYIDPRTSEMLLEVNRYSRIERWLYNGLHNLDFKFWYSKRPLWDIGMIVLLLGGLATSALGLYLGVKRLVRDLLPSRHSQKKAVSVI